MDLCDMKFPGSIMKCPWEDTTAKTHNQYINKVSEIIAGVIKTVAPDLARELWQAVMTNDKVSQFLQIPKPINDSLFQHLPRKKNKGKVDLAKLEHFLDFITSSNIVQDLPFGRTLMLTNGWKIDILNVIRMMLPSHLIKQYTSAAMKKTLPPFQPGPFFGSCLKQCVASVRKNLQGLDSYAAEGGRGFDDFVSLLDMLMQYGSSNNEIYNLKDNLKHLKQYLKSNYKVSSPIF